MRLFFSILLLALGVILVILPTSSLAAGRICDLNARVLGKEMRQEAKRVENLSPPLDRNRSADKAPQMTQASVRSMLSLSWRAFGYRGEALHKRVRLNMLQIKIDSDFRPHLQGLFPGEVAIPELDTPGGLFAISHARYQEWRNYSTWRGEISRFNPLSNIMAAVSAQVESKQIYSGQGRIRPPKKNPCA